MTIVDAVVLGVVQGLTEFIPVSSSGHMIIAEKAMHLDYLELKDFDIVLNIGTLLSVFIYFRKDFVELIKATYAWVMKHIFRHHRYRGQSATDEQYEKLVGYLIIGTIPAVVIGLFFGDFLDAQFRNPASVAVFLILVGLFFFIAEFFALKLKQKPLSLQSTVLIGIAQACALIPGVSRSGSTIATGLLTGLKREEAARFSFLLGSVAITAATVLSAYKILKGQAVLPPTDMVLTGVVSSFVAGYVAIAFLMQFLKKHTLHMFGIYRAVLGFAVLYLLL